METAKLLKPVIRHLKSELKQSKQSYAFTKSWFETINNPMSWFYTINDSMKTKRILLNHENNIEALEVAIEILCNAK